VWVGESSFWYRPTRVVPDQRPLNGRCCCCCNNRPSTIHSALLTQLLTGKVKPIWILLKQETVSGSGITWAICKSAPRSRQITTLAPHRLVFTDLLPPTASKHWRQSRGHCNWQIGLIFIAKLQMYRVRRPTINCHQTASKCTKSNKSRTQFQKFSGWYLRSRSCARHARGSTAPQTWYSGLAPAGDFCLQTPVPDWDSKKVATLV